MTQKRLAAILLGSLLLAGPPLAAETWDCTTGDDNGNCTGTIIKSDGTQVPVSKAPGENGFIRISATDSFVASSGTWTLRGSGGGGGS